MTDSLPARTPLLLALLLNSSIAWTAPDAFKTGVEHFKNGHYKEAISHFKKARQAGNESAVLHYNLGVSYFKLGRYRAAQDQFLMISRHKKLGALACYNLGLVAYKLKSNSAAVRWFRRSIERSNNPKIEKLASAQLRKLQPRSASRSAATKTGRWSGFFSEGIGSEDNVTRINEDITVSGAQSDIYWSAYGNLNYQLLGDRTQGTQLRLGAGLSRYKELSNYNQGLLNLGLYQYTTLNGWRLRYGLHYYYDELDGSGFQERIKASTRLSYRLNRRQRLRFNYEVSRLNEINPAYSYLSGLRQRIKAEHTLQNRDLRFRLRYTLELNDREDRQGPSSFTSYSPTRHTLLASVKSPVSESWSARTDLEYRYSGYPDANIANNLTTGTREDQRLRASLYATYHLSRNADIELRYRHTRNSSTLTYYEYSNNHLMLSVDYYF